MTIKEGCWMNDVLHGYGRIIKSTGEVTEGVFSYGELKNGQKYYFEGTFSGRIHNDASLTQNERKSLPAKKTTSNLKLKEQDGT